MTYENGAPLLLALLGLIVLAAMLGRRRRREDGLGGVHQHIIRADVVVRHVIVGAGA